jgi:esterase/lipase
MKSVYIISGFGADERVFSKLDFGDHKIHFIPWKIPEKKESMASYAERMKAEIHDPFPVLIGLSFGGMLSIEIAKTMPVEKILMISSVATFHEMPLYMKIAAFIPVNRMIHLRPYPVLERIENYNLGVETEEQKQLLKEYRQNIDQRYTDWAIENILHWKNEWRPPNLVHLHGSNDHIFPIKYVKADYVIEGGGHLMLMNNAAQVNPILMKELM